MYSDLYSQNRLWIESGQVWPSLLFLVKNHFLARGNFRACLQGGGGPRVGEVTCLAVVEKWLASPGSRGDVTRRCCVVASM